MTINNFLQELTDSDGKTRLRAIYQLGILGDTNAIPALQLHYKASLSQNYKRLRMLQSNIFNVQAR